MSGTTLFEAARLPVFQNKMFPDQASALACPTGEVRLVQEDATGLIHNAAFDPSLLEYGADYQNEQACSPVFQHHLESVSVIVSRHFSRTSLVEIGCGKGYFLEYLRARGFDILGMDPAYEGDNPNILRRVFDLNANFSKDGILLRHVLEHLQNPYEFLVGIATANGGKGLIYIEVPCFDWICHHRAWFDVFYEHVNYFRLSDFDRMFGRVIESGRVFGGQYLYVVADLASLRDPKGRPYDRCSFPQDFLSGLERIASRISAGKTAVWGAASKGVIFSTYMQRLGVDLDLLIDINPAKQGKYIPTAGLQVLSPEDALARLDPGCNLVVMNSNYLEEIVQASANRYHYIRIDHDDL